MNDLESKPDPAPPAPPAAKKPGVLFRRILFGVILLAISCGLLYVDWITRRSVGIAAMVGYSMVFGLRELYRMLASIGPIIWKRPAQVAGFLVVLGQLLQHEVPALRAFPLPLGDTVIGAYTLVFLANQLRFEPTRDRFVSIVVSLFGVLYIMLLGSYVLRLRYLGDAAPGLPPDIGYAAILYLVLAAKGTDMCAFFSGRFLGRRKMIPWISPGKTWAGGVGGLIGATAITLCFAFYSDLGCVFGWRAAVPFGIMIGLSATAGDLVESLIKRSTAVKDSGGLVPEFGGVLDIIDCILFAAPTIYYGALLLLR